MDLEVVPPLREAEQQALTHALARAGIPLDGPPPAYAGAWRKSAAREAVDTDPAALRQAPSPRRTRGATRA